MLWSAQFVAASSFLLTFFQSRKRDQTLDLHDFFLGLVSAAFSAAVAGTVIGVTFGAGLPPVFAFGASLFLPVYFALLLAGDVKGGYEIAAVLCGFALTPPVELLLPGWGVIVSALSVGAVLTAAER
jgi:predicted branched-subunit amino acid permease